MQWYRWFTGLASTDGSLVLIRHRWQWYSWFSGSGHSGAVVPWQMVHWCSGADGSLVLIVPVAAVAIAPCS